MITTIKTISYFTVALVTTFALLVPMAFADHTWGNYHWARTANPFTLQTINSMSGQWQPALNQAVADWNQSSVLDLALVAGSAKRGCRGQDGMVETCNAVYGNTNWLGIAQIWVNGDHITKGVVKMNDTYYNTAYYNTDAWRNTVVCQEIGHAFGLGHQDEDFSNANLDTCMDYTSSPESNQHPNAHDYDLLETIYAHVDSFNSYVAPSTDGGGGGGGKGKGKPSLVGQDINLDTPSAWGETVKTDAQGNPSLYKRNLGNNQIVFTHVTWIEGYDDHTHEEAH